MSGERENRHHHPLLASGVAGKGSPFHFESWNSFPKVGPGPTTVSLIGRCRMEANVKRRKDCSVTQSSRGTPKSYTQAKWGKKKKIARDYESLERLSRFFSLQANEFRT